MTDTTRIQDKHITDGMSRWFCLSGIKELNEIVLYQSKGSLKDFLARVLQKAIDEGIVSPPVDIKVDEHGNAQRAEDGDLLLFARTMHDDLSQTAGYAHYKGQI